MSCVAIHSESMNHYLRSDEYIHVSRDCPMNIDMHPADDLVEIALGEHRVGGATLRIIADHPDACRRLAEALHNAGDTLVEHLRAKAPVSRWT
jgi:peptide subunit release factor 1 (eRF1)